MEDLTLPKLTTMLYSCVSSTIVLLASMLRQTFVSMSEGEQTLSCSTWQWYFADLQTDGPQMVSTLACLADRNQIKGNCAGVSHCRAHQHVAAPTSALEALRAGVMGQSHLPVSKLSREPALADWRAFTAKPGWLGSPA